MYGIMYPGDQRRPILPALPALLLALSISACSTPGPAPVVQGGGGPIPGAGSYKIGKPYKVAGVWYYPKEEPKYDRTGIASWYGRKFHGRATANGERYDMNALTAAHKTLPLPTYVRVTNLDNGRYLVLRINDRGPFVNGRIIDVSRRGAEALGFRKAGTARVRVQAVPNPNRGRFILARVKTAPEEANMVAAPRDAVSSKALAPPPGMRAAPRVRQSSLTSSLNGAKAPPGVSSAAVQPTQIYVQAGAFTLKGNARAIGDRLRDFGPVKVTPVRVGDQEFYRVRIGPLRSVAEADKTLADVLDSGQEARIVVETCPC